MADALAAADPPTSGADQLSEPLDLIKHEVLSHEKNLLTEAFNTAKALERVRNKFKKRSTLADDIGKAVEELAEARLITKVGDQKQKGRKAGVYKKVPYSQIKANEAAESERKRLNISRESFQ